MTKLRGSLLVCSLLLAAVALAAGEANTLVSADGGKFELPWSAEWEQATLAEVGATGVAFQVEGDPHAMRVLVAPGPSGDARAQSEEALRAVIGKMIESVAAQAVESALEPRPLTGGKQKGFFVHATDKAPKPEEYQYVDFIVVAAGDAPLIVTVLSNDPGAKHVAQVRAAMADIVYHAP
ncbi:MAG TPA: hypothetical protein VM146_05015 [Steroidobacteraceae bacterium]|nr:hypothetical protein [Steroidobacteraceae bacterium]